MNHYQVIRRPLVTEKGHDYKDNLRTLCFEVSTDAKHGLDSLVPVTWIKAGVNVQLPHRKFR